MERSEATRSPSAGRDAIRLWLIAVFGFGLGDVATTSVGLGLAGVVEAHPLVASLVRQSPLWSMVSLKIAVFAACYGLWRRTPRPHCVGVPLGLAVAGVSVTAWNLNVLLRTLA